jgi:hypothetical protein
MRPDIEAWFLVFRNRHKATVNLSKAPALRGNPIRCRQIGMFIDDAVSSGGWHCCHP